jgi:ubiquinol-cytochrome c reductase cytochrome c1 subunit
MKKLLTIASVLAGLAISFNVLASADVHLDYANTNINDQKSLQNGAKLFMNYCSGCHSISFMRYNRIGKDLNISDADVEKNLIFGDAKIGNQIISSMSKKGAEVWFGTTPPDLSLVSRSKGTDWIYTYLHSFYKDDSRPFGVNNKVLVNASMPDVLWGLKKTKSPEAFDQDVSTSALANTLNEIAKPAKTDAIVNNFFILFPRYSFRHFFGFSNRSKPWH